MAGGAGGAGWLTIRLWQIIAGGADKKRVDKVTLEVKQQNLLNLEGNK